MFSNRFQLVEALEANPDMSEKKLLRASILLGFDASEYCMLLEYRDMLRKERLPL